MASKKKPVKRKKPAAKLEIRKLLSEGKDESSWNVYKVKLGKDVRFLAGCRCFTKEEAIKHIMDSDENYYGAVQRKVYRKALDAAGKKISTEALLNDISQDAQDQLPVAIKKVLGLS